MNDNKSCRSVCTNINELPASESAQPCVTIQTRKLIRIILPIVIAICIALIIIIPTTVILTKKVNLTINATAPTIASLTSTLRTATAWKCIFTGQMNFFMPIHQYSSRTTADVDGDDKLDIIVAYSCYGKVRIFLNTGTGTFNDQLIYPAEEACYVYSIITADLDGDNKPDIIVTTLEKSTIDVFFNTGNGTFNDQVIYSTGPDSGPSSITTADVNGDKKSDIIVTNRKNNTIGVFLNGGHGTFNEPVTYFTGLDSDPSSIATADMNGDKKPDIIITNQKNNTVGVFLNRGNGTFDDQVIYPTGIDSSPSSIITDDVDGDKKPDITVVNRGMNNVGVFLNRGNGTLNDQVIYSTGLGSDPSSVTTADVDGDNKFDIIVVNHGTNNIGVFLNIGKGTFKDQVIYPAGIRFGGPICFTKHDIDGDTILDSLFAVSDTVGVRLS